MNFKGWLALGACLGQAGCATQPSTPAAALPGTAGCVFQSNVRGWTVLDNQTLLVEGPTSGNTYLVKLFAPVTNLPFEEVLAFEDGNHDGQLCSNGDVLHVGGPVRQDSPITAVRLLSAAEARQLRDTRKAGGKPAA